MKAYLTYHRAAVAVVAGVVAALSFSGVAQAITETVFRYSTPKTGYFSISAMAMNASQDIYNYYNGWIQGVKPVGAGVGCFSTGVNLPNGSTIEAITIFYKSGVTGEVSGHLYRVLLSNGSFNKIGERVFLDDAGIRKPGSIPVTASFAVVNNAQFSYGFGVCMDSNADTFYDARIRYTYNNAGD